MKKISTCLLLMSFSTSAFATELRSVFSAFQTKRTTAYAIEANEENSDLFCISKGYDSGKILSVISFKTTEPMKGLVTLRSGRNVPVQIAQNLTADGERLNVISSSQYPALNVLNRVLCVAEVLPKLPPENGERLSALGLED